MKELELNIEKIAEIGKIKEYENIDFRIFLKSQDDIKLDYLVQNLNKEIISQIDCRTCGNCCVQLKPCVTEAEMQKLAEIKNINTTEFKSRHVETDDFEDIQYLKDSPCIFLDNKCCSIYQNRPEDCKSYPHTHKSGFSKRLYVMIENYGICPIVFNLFEALKRELKYI